MCSDAAVGKNRVLKKIDFFISAYVVYLKADINIINLEFFRIFGVVFFDIQAYSKKVY
jgi:hypothetical protein